ncbi:hypothetical protein GCM10009579_37970 [Streptomyces javensis]|uniref:Uncharacterized protein n=1 Tax=Streptomyces javensis TaxID=114698 RepID=A0ABN1X264_9ACTN
MARSFDAVVAAAHVAGGPQGAELGAERGQLADEEALGAGVEEVVAGEVDAAVVGGGGASPC